MASQARILSVQLRWSLSAIPRPGRPKKTEPMIGVDVLSHVLKLGRSLEERVGWGAEMKS